MIIYGQRVEKLVSLRYGSELQQVPAIKKPLFGYILLFLNNNLLFYSLFYMKIEICFLYKEFLIRGNPLSTK